MKTKQLLTAFLLMLLSTWFLLVYQPCESFCAASTLVAPPVEWTKTYDGVGSLSASVVQQTSDGGYALFGQRDMYGWLVKVDSKGTMQWNESYGNIGVNAGQQTSDGGYILAGGNSLIKTDGTGNLLWRKTLDGNAFSAQQTSDGGFVLAGMSVPSGDNPADFYLLKTDPSGNVVWSKTFGVTSASETARSVQQTPDGGYILAGEKYSLNATWLDAWVVKTDQNGNMVWSKTFGNPDAGDGLYSVKVTSDGGYIMAGCNSYGNLYWNPGYFCLIKTDNTANVQWERTYGDSGFPGTQKSAKSVQQTTDGGYITIGLSGTDIWLIKTDPTGGLAWNMTFPGPGSNELDVVQASDRGYAVAYQTPRGTQDGAFNIVLTKIMRANPPVATYSYEPTNPLVQQTIIFNASASHDLDNDINSYKWDFKDGNITTTSNPAISHAFSTAGVYNVTLTVTDSEDLSSQHAQEISAKVYTSISLSASSATIYANSPVTFSGIISDSQGKGIGNVLVSIFDARSGSTQWNLIAEDLTDSQGNFDVTWNPSIIGALAIKAEWAGNQTHYGTNNVTKLEVLSNPTILSIHLSSSSSDVGLKVGISVRLTSNGVGFSGVPVLLSYSVTGGQTWNEMSQVTTAYDGSCSAIWMPSATGEYIVKAVWAGNVTVQGATAFTDLAVVPYDAKNVFSVTSNSTISALSFNSDSKELDFTVTGASGTYGYIDVFIAKTLIPNIDAVKAYLNGDPVQFTSSTLEDAYLLHFAYQHSSHAIVIMFGLSGSPLGIPISIETLALIGVAAAAICGGSGYYVWKRKTRQNSTPTKTPLRRPI